MPLLNRIRGLINRWPLVAVAAVGLLMLAAASLAQGRMQARLSTQGYFILALVALALPLYAWLACRRKAKLRQMHQAFARKAQAAKAAQPEQTQALLKQLVHPAQTTHVPSPQAAEKTQVRALLALAASEMQQKQPIPPELSAQIEQLTGMSWAQHQAQALNTLAEQLTQPSSTATPQAQATPLAQATPAPPTLPKSSG